jgi:hypothetical protein
LCKSNASEFVTDICSGYNGKDDWESAQVQELLGSIDDISSHLGPVFRMQDEAEKKKLMEKIISESVVPYFTRLQKRLEANGTGYFVGNSVRCRNAKMMFFMHILPLCS